MNSENIIESLSSLANSPYIGDREETAVREALVVVRAFITLQTIARNGYGPAFSQRAVVSSGRSAITTGEDLASFAAGIIALGKVLMPANKRCPGCGVNEGEFHRVPQCNGGLHCDRRKNGRIR